jgi:prolyl oligopeptidase
MRQTGFQGSFAEFLRFLRTDRQFYFESPDELLRAYTVAAKSIEPELVKLFRKLPRTPYGVRAVPDEIAKNTAVAYYMAPAADGSRAGYYYVNLYRPEIRAKYEIEVLTAHEAVPGHHLQIALSQELEGLPNFRRDGGGDGGTLAFNEGWGLYAESLGDQLGLYRDPYSKFGQLTYEIWRAARLVVDTGIHHKRWTRDQALAYFNANAARSEADIANEVDRYIEWPGQALAYKIGQLKILELRSRAQQKLGSRFDIREFHDVVLSNGPVPLATLEQLVDEWIASSV